VLGGLWHLELLPTLCGILGRGVFGVMEGQVVDVAGRL